MPQITKAGVYDGIAAEAYHGNCTPAPALSSSGAKTLASDDPAAARRFWLDSPLNPNRESVRKKVFDLGTMAHLAVLEPEALAARVAVIQADDFRTKAAQAERDAAWDAGLIPALPKDMDAIKLMRDAIMSDPVARHAFTGGVPERSYFWIDQEFGVWRKARLDYAPGDAVVRFIPDLKTTTDANPRAFEKRAADLGYHQSAAFYMDAIEHFHGTRPSRFFWVVVERDPPHMVSVCEASGDMLEWGRQLNRRALDLFRRCLDRGDPTNPEHWPAYGSGSHVIGLPVYVARDLERRRDAGDFVIADAPYQFHNPHAAAAFAGQAPAAE